MNRRELLMRLAQLWAGITGLALLGGCPGGSRHGKETQVDGTGVETPAAKPRRDRLMFELRLTRRNTVREITLEGRSAYLYHAYVDKEDIWLALDRACTHSGCLVKFNVDAQEFHCPCHGSVFDWTGQPLSGPAKTPLAQWEVDVAKDQVHVLLKG